MGRCNPAWLECVGLEKPASPEPKGAGAKFSAEGGLEKKVYFEPSVEVGKPFAAAMPTPTILESGKKKGSGACLPSKSG